MAEIKSVAELKAQFLRLQHEIIATYEMLDKLYGSTELVGICPDFCAPVRIVDPPRYFDDCLIRIPRIEGPITVEVVTETINMLRKWNDKMIEVFEDVDPDLPLPFK